MNTDEILAELKANHGKMVAVVVFADGLRKTYHGRLTWFGDPPTSDTSQVMVANDYIMTESITDVRTIKEPNI